MSIVANPRAGWAMSGASASAVGFWLVLGGPRHSWQDGVRPFIETAYSNIVFGLLFPLVGAIILSRVPGHRLGWLYCLSGLASALALASYSYAERGLVEQPGSLPGAVAAAWLSSWIWVCGFSPLLTFGILGFPDGRLPSRRWWPVAALAALTIELGAASIAVRPGPLENHPVRDNPLGAPLPRPWLDWVGQGGWIIALLLAIIGSFAGLVVRYRRGPAAERAQLRWCVLSVGLLLVSFAIPAGSELEFVGNLLALVAFPLLPLSMGAAVLRRRFDDLGVGPRRALVYGWLIAGELTLYVTVVSTLDTVLRGHARPVVALIGAGAVAVLYQPLRLRLQRSTDRLFYGNRGDPYAVLTSLGRRLEAAGSAEQTLPTTAAAVAEALRLPYVAITLPGDRPEQPSAAYGSGPGISPLSIPLVHGGANVGRLVVGRRSPSEDVTSAERRLLDDLARHVAVAASAVLLSRALRRSRELLVVAREEERRRLRRDLHDGLGPALAGLALGVDAARNLMPTNPSAAETLLGELKNETLGCVGEVRRIVEDLRPPTLDQLGLVPALTVFAERLSNRDHALRVNLDSPDPLPELPAAVEVAAYRIATEAMTNVARHAGAASCLLRLSVGRDLTVEVSDDGVGIPPTPSPGVGLPSMAERASELGGECTISPVGDCGTRVLAHLPLAAT